MRLVSVFVDQSHAPGPPTSFETVVCGIDSSGQSVEAADQARSLAAEDAKLWAVSAWDPGLAVHAGIHARQVLDDLREESAAALSKAVDAVPGIEKLQFQGPPVASLLAAAGNLSADLVAVGASGTSRSAGVLFGFVATAMAHHAPCSVLISRRCAGPFPGRILHAGDGSPNSLEAARVAGAIAARHGADVTTLHVGADETEESALVSEESLALAEVAGAEPSMLRKRGRPQRVIVEQAAEIGASLIVLGSRGRTGLSALGSVSESVSHHASCSVLIVRRPVHPA